MVAHIITSRLKRGRIEEKGEEKKIPFSRRNFVRKVSSMACLIYCLNIRAKLFSNFFSPFSLFLSQALSHTHSLPSSSNSSHSLIRKNTHVHALSRTLHTPARTPSHSFFLQFILQKDKHKRHRYYHTHLVRVL